MSSVPSIVGVIGISDGPGCCVLAYERAKPLSGPTNHRF